MKYCKSLLLVLFLIFNVTNAQKSFINYKNATRVNPKTGNVIGLYNVNSKKYEGKPENVARQFLSEKKELFGYKNLKEEIKFSSIRKYSYGSIIYFRQKYKNVPVWGSSIIVNISNENKINSVNSKYLPIGKLDIKNPISKNEAIILSRNYLNKELDESLRFYVDKYIYNNKDNSHLVWVVEIASKNNIYSRTIILDAVNGIILKEINPIFSSTTGSGDVFVLDPVTKLRNPSLDYQSNVNAAYETVQLLNLNNPISNLYYLKGSYAESNDTLVIPKQGLSTSNNGEFFGTRGEIIFEEANVYYHLNKIHNYIKSLGFDPEWTYSTKIVSAPGEKPIIEKPDEIKQIIRFDVRYKPTPNPKTNAYYNSSELTEYIVFGDVSNTGPSPAEDLSYIVHEFGHAIHDGILYEGTQGAYDESDTKGISEGFADYLSISYRRSLQNDPFQPNNRSNWCLPQLSPTTNNVGIENVNDAKYPDDWGIYSREKMRVWASQHLWILNTLMQRILH